jgi:uncharacterized protein (TIGR03435 family)
MKSVAIAFLCCCASNTAFAQSATSAQSFEAASIRVRQGAPQWKFSISGSRLSIGSYTLFGLIKEAWNLQNYQIRREGAPPLLLSDDTLYDIEATARTGPNTTREGFRLMLRQLLADRFRLKIHNKTEEMPVYALVVGKNGPRFQSSALEADPQVNISLTGENKEYALITSRKISMEEFARLLSPVDGRPVLDRTGLNGTWDIRLSHTPDYRMSRGPDPVLGEISIFTALQEQLGLKLESQKGMVDVLVGIALRSHPKTDDAHLFAFCSGSHSLEYLRASSGVRCCRRLRR